MNNDNTGAVTISGIARDAMGGAVITATDKVVYVHGLDSWPAALAGKKVIATGRLSEEQYIPESTVADDGAVSAGAVGKQWVLREANWHDAY